MKPRHLPITGHDLLAVERFRDSTRHMIEFLVLADCPMGKPGEYVRRFLAEDGYDPEFGARPVKRTIQRMVLNQLSKDILAQKVDREHPIVIDRKDDELVFVNK